jgi:hypothetical protein
MIDLNTMELTEIQGGNIVGRLLTLIANVATSAYGIIDLTKLVVQNGNAPDYDNVNQMGDYK